MLDKDRDAMFRVLANPADWYDKLNNNVSFAGEFRPRVNGPLKRTNLIKERIKRINPFIRKTMDILDEDFPVIIKYRGTNYVCDPSADYIPDNQNIELFATYYSDLIISEQILNGNKQLRCPFENNPQLGCLSPENGECEHIREWKDALSLGSK